MAAAKKPSKKSPPPDAAPGRLSFEDGLAWLVLDDPAKRVNTLSSRLFGWFEEQLDRLERERPRAVVVISGKPDGFVAGADVGELAALDSPEAVLALLARGHRLSGRFAALPALKVAAIHGACLGGGLELALLCDLRVATDHPKTRLGLPEVQLGLIPGMGGTQRLPRLIGHGQTMRLVLTGDMIGAEEAQRIGLVELVVPHDELREKTLELAGRIAAMSPLTLKIAKEAVNASRELPLEAGIRYERDLFCLCFSSEDMAEGVEAFLQKRPAEWRGR